MCLDCTAAMKAKTISHSSLVPNNNQLASKIRGEAIQSYSWDNRALCKMVMEEVAVEGPRLWIRILAAAEGLCSQIQISLDSKTWSRKDLNRRYKPLRTINRTRLAVSALVERKKMPMVIPRWHRTAQVMSSWRTRSCHRVTARARPSTSTWSACSNGLGAKRQSTGTRRVPRRFIRSAHASYVTPNTQTRSTWMGRSMVSSV